MAPLHSGWQDTRATALLIGGILLDVSPYLKRIRYQGSLQPTSETLQVLHEAHLLAIPFENLAIHLGQPIILQEEALYEKIVYQCRGGFCYELNGLFAWLLHHLGFAVSLLSAEVAHEDGSFSPAFDHLALCVHRLSGSEWLVDVGFGDSFRRPLRLVAGLEHREADGHIYRLIRSAQEQCAPAHWIMQRQNRGSWEAQYRFTLEPHVLSEFSARCQYHQTSPQSHFTQKRICSLATSQGRVTLSDWQLITTTQGERTEQTLSGQEQYTGALATHFGVVLSLPE
jgi:N-hydroxyarylamine O-acetyltransferase